MAKTSPDMNVLKHALREKFVPHWRSREGQKRISQEDALEFYCEGYAQAARELPSSNEAPQAPAPRRAAKKLVEEPAVEAVNEKAAH